MKRDLCPSRSTIRKKPIGEDAGYAIQLFFVSPEAGGLNNMVNYRNAEVGCRLGRRADGTRSRRADRSRGAIQDMLAADVCLVAHRRIQDAVGLCVEPVGSCACIPITHCATPISSLPNDLHRRPEGSNLRAPPAPPGSPCSAATIIRRLLIGVLQLIGLVIAVFFLIRLLPPIPSARLVGMNASDEAYAQRSATGPDRPSSCNSQVYWA